MIIKATSDELIQVEEYINNDPVSTVYIGADIQMYGFNRDFLEVWLQLNHDRNIGAIIMRYHNGMQFYSKTLEFDVEEITGLIDKISPQVIGGQFNSVNKLFDALDSKYKLEMGTLAVYDKQTKYKNSEYIIERATLDDVDEISQLICSDMKMSEIYSQNEIAQQIKERMIHGFGRNYVVRVDGNIVAHAATYAETSYSAVIGGVITKENFRRKGYSTAVVGKLCNDLIVEGRTPCLFYYDDIAGKVYHKLGFSDYTKWGKLIKIKG